MGIKTTFATRLTDVYALNASLPNSGAREPLGTIRYENTAQYKYVQFSGTTAVAVGDVVCYVAAAGDGNLGIVDGANTAVAAGVAMAAVPSGTVQFGWIQISGLATLSTALGGSPAAGDALTTTGATAPGVIKASVANHMQCANAYDVTNRKVVCNFIH